MRGARPWGWRRAWQRLEKCGIRTFMGPHHNLPVCGMSAHRRTESDELMAEELQMQLLAEEEVWGHEEAAAGLTRFSSILLRRGATTQGGPGRKEPAGRRLLRILSSSADPLQDGDLRLAMDISLATQRSLQDRGPPAAAAHEYAQHTSAVAIMAGIAPRRERTVQQRQLRLDEAHARQLQEEEDRELARKLEQHGSPLERQLVAPPWHPHQSAMDDLSMVFLRPQGLEPAVDDASEAAAAADDDYEQLLALDEQNVKVGVKADVLDDVTVNQSIASVADLRRVQGSHKDCAVCLDDFAVGNQLRRLPCLCVYHVACIDEWLQQSKLCPKCRQPVTE